jgi:hypothetical protein
MGKMAGESAFEESVRSLWYVYFIHINSRDARRERKIDDLYLKRNEVKSKDKDVGVICILIILTHEIPPI